MSSVIPYSRQHINDSDVQAVRDALSAPMLTQGPRVAEFEHALQDYCQAKHVIAVCNATAALHLACMTVGLQSGDWLWTSPLSFLASANCGLYCGANVDFVDIDPVTYNISAKKLEEKLREAKQNGKLPKVVVVVHFAGQVCDMVAISKLSKEYGFILIEDAAHAVGAEYMGGKVGDCRYSDIAIFSFHPVKGMTTGEGGALLCKNTEYYNRAKSIATHGIVRDKSLFQFPNDQPWYYEQQFLGYNFRITDFQAALGTSQLARLDSFIAERHEQAQRYDDLLQELSIQLPWRSSEHLSALHLYPILLENAEQRKTVFNAMRTAGIYVQVHYIPIYKQPYYKQICSHIDEAEFANCEDYYSRTMSIPLFPGLTGRQQDYVVDNLKKLLWS